MNDTILDKCPDCNGENLKQASQLSRDSGFWEENDNLTACMDCETVFDQEGRLAGGFNNEVAQELYDAFKTDLKNQLGLEE